jgi:hypothetical protein
VQVKWLLKQEDVWREARAHKAQVVELFVPDLTINVK